jgi:DUF1009 family protein
VRFSLRPEEMMDLLVELGADAPTVLAAIRRSKMFQEENKRNVAGINEGVIGFSHETMGKFLASRRLKNVVQGGGTEAQDRLKMLARQERFLDTLFFLIDELNRSQDLNFVLQALVDAADPCGLKVVAYAIHTQPVDLIDSGVIAAFTKAQVMAQIDEAHPESAEVKVA